MASNTTYKPTRVIDFEAAKLNADFQSIQGTAAAGVSTNFDLVMTNDELITGMEVIAMNSTFGDTITFQLLAGTAYTAYGYAATQVLNQFVTNWGVCTDSQKKISKEIDYPAKFITGTVVRVVYKSYGTTPVNLIINLDLHKVLV